MSNIIHAILAALLPNLGPILAVWLANEGLKLTTWFNGLGPQMHGLFAVVLTYFAAAATGQPMTQDAVLAAYQALIQVFFPVQQALKAHRATKGLRH